MTGFTDVFGGSTLQAAQVAYAAVSLSADITTVWPPYATGSNQYVARLMDVTPSASSLSINLPDATLVTAGQDVFFSNPGVYTYTINDYDGNSIATVPPGTQRYLYLTNNSTKAGTWRSILMGIGSSSPDASQLAGYGLKAIGATLNQSAAVSTISASQSLAVSDRSKVYVNTGGAITLVLPLTASTGSDFFLEIRNQGSGTVTLSPSGGELIDGSAAVSLQLNESCFIHAGTGAWYTVGRGRNQSFNFTQLLKSVTGGTTTLSLTEASNVVQTYSGVAVSNVTIVLPSVVQVYYISNQVTGGFTFTLQSPTPGSTLTIPSGQNAVVFCDGINVINSSTSITGLSSLTLSAGSVGAPSLGISAANNGLYAPSSTSVAVTAAGTENVRWTGGQTRVPDGAVGAPSYSFSTSTGTGMWLASSNVLAFSTNATKQISIDASGHVLPGTNNAQNLGSASFAFANIYGTTFTGTSFTGNAASATNATSASTAVTLSATLAVNKGGTGVTSSTGSTNVVLSDSPTLTGTPLAPTAATSTNTTQLATTAFVQSVFGSVPVGSLPSLAGNALKFLQVNAGETAVAWAPMSSMLSGITAATGSATIANGNNPITWNWAQTTASQSAFKIGETSAATGGSGAQYLLSVATVAASTANPFNVATRGVDTIVVSRTGDVTITGLNATTVGGGQAGASINIAGGAAGSGASASGGAVTIASGAAANGTNASSGNVSLKSGSGFTQAGQGSGTVTVGSGSAASSAPTGDVTILSGNTGSASTGNISINVGTSGTGLAGILSLNGGVSGAAQSGNSGGIVLTAGSTGAVASVAGGPIVLTAGAGSTTTTGGVGGAITITAGTGGLAAAGGALTLASGAGGASGVGGDINITTGTGTSNGRVNFTNTNVANGAVAVTLTSLGPTGAATTVQGWLAIKVGGTARYIPFW